MHFYMKYLQNGLSKINWRYIKPILSVYSYVTLIRFWHLTTLISNMYIDERKMLTEYINTLFYFSEVLVLLHIKKLCVIFNNYFASVI